MAGYLEIMNEFPQELRRPIGRLIDVLKAEFAVRREDFSTLTEKVERLAEAQIKTEERVGSLEVAVERLAEAQIKTEVELTSLAKAVKGVQKELGGLSNTVGFSLENESYRALPRLLKERFGLEVEGRLKRIFAEYPDGREDEVNIFGKGKKDGRALYIIGEAKVQLSTRHIDGFLKKMGRLKLLYPEDKFLLMVTHSARPRIIKYGESKGVAIFQSFEFF
ncbi:MAG: hypothetical protein JRF35_08360 [Deltaproteobacteria bacterium]|nr:hypothetical protein [Deltaproteobacteria bacterium]